MRRIDSTVIGENVPGLIAELEQEGGGDILMGDRAPSVEAGTRAAAPIDGSGSALP